MWVSIDRHYVVPYVHCFVQKPRFDYVNTTCQTRTFLNGYELAERERHLKDTWVVLQPGLSYTTGYILRRLFPGLPATGPCIAHWPPLCPLKVGHRQLAWWVRTAPVLVLLTCAQIRGFTGSYCIVLINEFDYCSTTEQVVLLSFANWYSCWLSNILLLLDNMNRSQLKLLCRIFYCFKNNNDMFKASKLKLILSHCTWRLHT